MIQRDPNKATATGVGDQKVGVALEGCARHPVRTLIEQSALAIRCDRKNLATVDVADHKIAKAGVPARGLWKQISFCEQYGLQLHGFAFSILTLKDCDDGRTFLDTKEPAAIFL